MNQLNFKSQDIDLIIGTLHLHLKDIDKFESTEYFESYFEFIKYFKKLDVIDCHSLIISSYFTYGWMPTILKKFNTQNNITEAIEIFNKIKNNKEIVELEYFTLIDCINNSIVGVSKLLHFINPNEYPIFDSRIKKYFKHNNLLESIYQNTYHNKNQSIKQYQTYRRLCQFIIEDKKFNEIYNLSIYKLGLDGKLTKMRVLENLFFYFGKYQKN